MTEFFGHLHPVLVHLPIGILLLACLFQLLSTREKFSSLRPAIGISLLLGMLGAIISCITGFLLSKTDDYDEQLVERHQWFGISVGVISIVLYYLHQKSFSNRIQSVVAALTILLIMITGHLGGSLTHGSDYLTKSFFPDSSQLIKRKPIPNVQEAVVYTDIVQPLLQEKCYSCHGKNKQKGGLRMDLTDRLMKGGKDGVVIIPGNVQESELVRRVLLPRNDDDHMPPKEKSQLKENEIALLHWWVESGAFFDKKVKELSPSEKIKPVLLALQNTGEEKKSIPDVPATPIDQAKEGDINKLKDIGVIVMPVSQNSNYLMANFVTASYLGYKDVQLLLPLKNQLVWLKLGNTSISDSSLSILAECKNLTRLHLDNTPITDSGLVYLKGLTKLQYLNLVGTKVSAHGLSQLKDLKILQSIYLYQTNVKAADFAGLRKVFPGAHIDSGGYVVPMLPSDTTVVKQKKTK